MRFWMMCAAAALLAGCDAASDPAAEPPVQLQPGLYAVELGGGSFAELKGGGTWRELCLGADSALMFKSDPLAALLPGWKGCQADVNTPAGNALKGVRHCPGGPGKGRAMTAHFEYAGRHDATSFQIEGEIRQGDDEGGGIMHLGSGPVTIRGRRAGDC